jgi:ubiquinone/menaquinone biosynthesis C-methylase UbiE
MTAENAEFKMSYLNLQAYAGVTKHMGGFEATNELLSLCHIKNAQEVLVDISEKMIEWSRQRIKQKGVEDRVEFQTADMLDLPFETDRFDVAYTIEFGADSKFWPT